MEIGMIGLGKMGANMAERLIRGGHRVVGYDRAQESLERAAEKGIVAVDSLEALVEELSSPRAVWVMVPAGPPVDENIEALLGLLAEDDVILDGGNSNYNDTQKRAAMVGDRGLHYVDVGTSGGVWGLDEGYSMMIGGPEEAVERLRPIFETLAPAADKGWGRVGPSGAGHFVKMVHNGIEYGMMQAFAEGFAIMKRKETLGLDLHQVSEIWRYGSVVRSWLLDLLAPALAEDQTLEGVAPYVADSGEGRWMVFESIDLDVPAPVSALSLIQRLRSRDEESYGDRLLAVLRRQFGGHAIKPKE
ncbi:MAG: decarboxylating 6-phosphogluconate dehydrogenase [bacterium]|nr:decarboxylating 6-phosphogluconate dehydrogenase [bacterium]